MAEWINLFDLGECEIEVYRIDLGDELLYSAVIDKGGTAQFTDSNGTEYVLEVSSEGSVSLQGADGISSASYEVFVYVNHPPAPARIRLVTLGTDVAAAGGTIVPFGEIPGVQVRPFDTVNPPAPDPLDMSMLTGNPDEGVGMAFSNGGIG